MNKLKIILLIFMGCISYSAKYSVAHDDHVHSKESALAISMAFDAQGSLWRVVEKNGLILVSSSRDLGKTFSSPVQVTPNIQEIGAYGEARPKLAIGPEGNIYLTWTEALKKPFTGYIWFSRSINGGKSFEKPLIVHTDRAEITHRFDELNVAKTGDAKGKVTVTWVDKRDLIAAKSAGKPYEGAAIYYATSSNQGASFTPEKKLADSSCECCRIALTNKPDGTVVAMWRHVFEGSERDHMIAEVPVKLNQAPVTKRATFGRWKIDGCPHHGAALTAGGEGKDWWGYHMAWFDGGNDDSGKDASLFYARMDGEAWVSSPPKKFGKHSNQAGHPALLSLGENVWLVWREIENKNNKILGMFSDDGGRSWGAPKELATTAGKTDYPILLAKDKQAYLAWNTENDGLILLGL
jgi:hypothetical protein